MRLPWVYTPPVGMRNQNYRNYYLTSSSDGKFVARSNDPRYSNGTSDLFTFNRATGMLNHQERFNRGGGGVAFSPNSEILYVGMGQQLYQFNLTHKNIKETEVVLNIESESRINDIQPGPDGKLYIGFFDEEYLGCVNFPDSFGHALNNKPGIVQNEPKLYPETFGGFSLLNNVNTKLISNSLLDFDYKLSSCSAISFFPALRCDTSVLWDFGDNSTSTQTYPVHAYLRPGSYVVSLVSGTDTVIKELDFGPVIKGDTLICDTSLTYTFHHPYNQWHSYKWAVTNGAVIGADDNTEVSVKFNGTGTIQLILNDERIPCLDSFTQTIHFGINTDSVFKDTIFMNTPPAFVGCDYDVSGSVSYDIFPNYTWYLSENRMDWDTTGEDSSGVLGSFIGSNDTLWLTRTIQTACFTSYSDTLPVTGQMHIYQQPQDYFSCVGDVFVNIGIDNPWSLPYTIEWEGDTSGNGDWMVLAGFTDTFYQSATPMADRYRAILHTGTCNQSLDTANFYQLADSAINTISLDNGACFPGASFMLDGDSASLYGQDTSIHYQWQKWTSTGWRNTSNTDSLRYLNGITAYDSVFYRRKVASEWCENYSDSILISPHIRIVEHPQDVSKCVGDGSAQGIFKLGTDVSSFGSYKPYFVVKKYEDIGGFYYSTEDSTEALPYGHSLDSIEYSLGHYSYEYFFRISTPCGYYHSDTALIHSCYSENPDDWTVTMPDTTYITEDSSVEFITHYDQCNGGPPIAGSYVYWQYSNNESDWFTINDTCGDTLRFTASYCENGFYYRMVYHETCTDEDRSSPIGRLFVTRTNFAKLMMRDYYDDDGTEPNGSTDWRNLYDPPSLLIRRAADNGLIHQTPDWGNDTAYVYYTIHNIDDTDTSKPAKLKMYWTSGGPHGADWEIAWQDVAGNRFYNDDSNNGPAYQQTYPYGDFINEIPIEVPSIAPGDSIRNYFVWTAFPNPLRYYDFTSGAYNYSNPRPMCLLARVETCPQDSFGMSYKEIAATRQNIINNRKIVGRNTHVTNLDSVLGKKEVGLTVRRFAGDDDPVRLKLYEVGSCGFATYGTIKAVLSDALWEAWKDGGYSGSGYLIDSYGILSVSSISAFELGNIALDSDSVETINFEFELNTLPISPLNCRYAFAQFQGESLNPYGTFLMDVNTIGGPGSEESTIPIKQEEASEEDSLRVYNGAPQTIKNDSNANEKVIVKNTLIDKSLFAYPNPFTDEVTFYFELNATQNVSFEIYDGLGAIVGHITSHTYPDGKHKVTFYGGHLAPGMYLCKVRIGEEIKTLRLIIAR